MHRVHVPHRLFLAINGYCDTLMIADARYERERRNPPLSFFLTHSLSLSLSPLLSLRDLFDINIFL